MTENNQLFSFNHFFYSNEHLWRETSFIRWTELDRVTYSIIFLSALTIYNSLVYSSGSNFSCSLQSIREQESLKSKVVLQDDFPWTVPATERPKGNKTNTGDVLKYVGGVDISFSKDDHDNACAALVVVDLEDGLNVVYEDFALVRLQIPYIPGFLAFREAPVLIGLLDRMKQRGHPFFPQVLLVDGNGVLHPRGFGLACHLGAVADIPSIGIGKNLHHVDGLTQSGVKQLLEANCGKSVITLVGDSGCVWGAALRSTCGSSKPIFISSGHRVSLYTAIRIVKMCCQYRVPEPIRQADIRSRSYLNEHGHFDLDRA